MAKEFFSFDPDNGITLHDTEAAARESTLGDLELYRDISSEDGWHEQVTDLCYGQVLGTVEQTSYIPRPPESEINEDREDKDGHYWGHEHWSYIAAYDLKPNSNGWTPIRDLPKEEGEYFVVLDTGEEGNPCLSFGVNRMSADWGKGQRFFSQYVIAWMPIPEYHPPTEAGGGQKR